MRRGARVIARGANHANRDSLVLPAGLSLPAFLLSLVLAGCSPRPPADVTIAVREASGENDLDADPDTIAEPPAPVALVAASAADPQLVWLASDEEALERGLAERRPMLVYFDAYWCADCKRMVSETFGDPRVQTQAGRFVAVRIDATDDEDPQVSAALSKYAVVSVPTLLLFDSSGHEQRRFTDLVGPETLLAEIGRVR